MNPKVGLFRYGSLLGVLLLVLSAPAALARDAAFLDPGASGAAADEGAIKVEPKADIDTGESVLNVAKRTTLFFINQTNQPIQVEKIAVNGDGNVTAEVANDDCSKQSTIAALSRCSVEISVTPTSPGSWSVDALLTHNGAGRIARAKLSGKTSGTTAAAEKKDTGLALSTKDVSPVNFGDVEVGTGKAVRSALMVNDSPEPITLYAIDVIEAENGLSRLEQGCAVDMELKPGESCPVTLVWTPTDRGQVSTDLIIRHSGRLGFAVIPIRGNAKGNVLATSKDIGTGNKITIDQKGTSLPSPPSALDLEKAAKIAPVSISSLNSSTVTTAATLTGTLRLIGTVGNRALLLTPDGTTAVVSVGDEFDMDGKKAKVISMTGKTAEISVDGKKRTLTLGAAPELTSHAAASSRQASETSASSLNGALPSSASPPPSTTSLGIPPGVATTGLPAPGTASAGAK